MKKTVKVEVMEMAGKCINHKMGDKFEVGLMTEAGICTKLLHSIYPYAMYLMSADSKTVSGSLKVTCPDGIVRVKLTQHITE
ncbi:MAG: TIGR04076 family protein [Spirochaetota bacterium]